MRKMRISIFSGLALIASLSAAQIRAVPHYDPSTETSLTGTVQEVTQQVRGRMGRIHVSLATDAGWQKSWNVWPPADRNTVGLAGWEQFVLFLVAAVGALFTSLFLASLLWPTQRQMPPSEEDGVEALRRMSYLEALASRWAR